MILAPPRVAHNNDLMPREPAPPPASEGANLPRNFTITTAERLRALAAGPPAFARRLRRIEDLGPAIVRAILEHEADHGSIASAASLPDPIRAEVERLNRLIDDHNRYYPIEAHLPMDLRTRSYLDWGEPWSPLPPVSAEELLTRAHEPRRG